MNLNFYFKKSDVKVLEGSDKLYIEQIDVGEEKPRQILSGLRLFVPLEEMKDRLVLVVCNLEPRSMAKTLSYGMVLAASNQDHTVVELVNPPPNSKIGERVTFDGIFIFLFLKIKPINSLNKRIFWRT